MGIEAAAVLVVAAWEPELRRLRAALEQRPALAPRTRGRTVGIGLVEAAIGATRAIAEARAAVVIFVGTAGFYPRPPGRDTGAQPGLAVGTAAVVRRIQLLSSAAVAGQAYFPRALPTFVETDAELRRELSQTGLPTADLACPLGITQTVATGLRTASATGCALENLEAFAVGRAAAVAGLPFAAVLGISNAVGPTAHEEWKTHAAEASAAACDAVVAWLDQRGG